MGVSCHGWDPIEASVDCDWIDVQLARINPTGAKMDGPPEEVAAHLKKMHAKGRGVLGMKIFGEGDFTMPQQRFASLKYVLGLGSVDAFTIGFSSGAQIDETLAMIEKVLGEQPRQERGQNTQGVREQPAGLVKAALLCRLGQYGHERPR